MKRADPSLKSWALAALLPALCLAAAAFGSGSFAALPACVKGNCPKPKGLTSLDRAWRPLAPLRSRATTLGDFRKLFEPGTRPTVNMVVDLSVQAGLSGECTMPVWSSDGAKLAVQELQNEKTMTPWIFDFRRTFASDGKFFVYKTVLREYGPRKKRGGFSLKPPKMFLYSLAWAPRQSTNPDLFVVLASIGSGFDLYWGDASKPYKDKFVEVSILEDDSAWELYPSWAVGPKGEGYVVFLRGDSIYCRACPPRGGLPAVKILDARRHGLTACLCPRAFADPAKKELRVAFCAKQGSNSGLFVVTCALPAKEDRGEAKLERLWQGARRHRLPEWSPDGMMLSFYREHPDWEQEIHWGRLAGRARRFSGDGVIHIYGGTEQAFVGPTFFPDGGGLGYVQEQPGSDLYELWVGSAGGRPTRAAFEGRKELFFQGGQIAYCPRGGVMAFTAVLKGRRRLYLAATNFLKPTE